MRSSTASRMDFLPSLPTLDNTMTKICTKSYNFNHNCLDKIEIAVLVIKHRVKGASSRRSGKKWRPGCRAPYSFLVPGMRRKPEEGGVGLSKKRGKEDKFEEPRCLFENPSLSLPIVVRINVGKKASEEG